MYTFSVFHRIVSEILVLMLYLVVGSDPVDESPGSEISFPKL